MNPVELFHAAKEAIMAFPEASFALFVGGLVIGWVASFAFAHKEVKVTRILIDELRRPGLSEATKTALLASAPRRRGIGPWIKSLGTILIAALVGATVTWLMQPRPTMFPARHLTLEQKSQMKLALQLGSNEHYSFQVNSMPSCEECELFAEEIREFFNTIPGWTASGSPLIFAQPSWRGLRIISRDDEQRIRPVEKINKAFSDVGIPLTHESEELEHGGFIIVIGRPKP